MDQARPLLGAEAQRIEHAVDMPLGAAAALHGEAGRLVERDHPVVAVDDELLDLGGVALRHGGPSLGLSGGLRRRRNGDAGRQTHGLAGLDAVLALDPLAVEPDLAGAQELLQRAVAQLREMTLEPAVQPKPGLVVGDGARLDAAEGGGLTLMAPNLGDILNRVHGIAVVRHADLRPSGGLPAGTADGEPAPAGRATARRRAW